MKKVFSILLSLILALNLSIPAFAANLEHDNTDMYLYEQSETILIDEVSYTYYYVDSNHTIRAIEVVNNSTGQEDVVTFNCLTSELYLNGKMTNMVSTDYGVSVANYTDGWESLGTSTHRISWAQGTSAGVVAAMLAAFLGATGHVYSAIGVAGLGALAQSTTGGTLKLELQWYNIPLVTPQYRYIWSFTANTGDVYGPYITHVPQPVS